jgi:hypothetical protein
MTISQDDIQKSAFLLLPLNEQMAVLFDMQRYLRGEIASVKKEFIDFEEELRQVRRNREKREEKHDQDMLTTTEKIALALSKRFDVWTYFRDKILPQILTLIIIGLLYLIFGVPR